MSNTHPVTLQQIVTKIHNLISMDSEVSSLPSLQFVRKGWPLKKGVVEQCPMLAWNQFETEQDTVIYFLAFLIRLFYLEQNKNLDKNKDISLQQLFYQNYLCAFFWNDIKKYFVAFESEGKISSIDKKVFFKKYLPRNKTIVLCVEDSYFRLRSGTNQDLACFETFLEENERWNNSLIVFSCQHLQKVYTSPLFRKEYSISFKMEKNKALSCVEEAMEPQAHLLQNKQLVEPLKTGAFDRLLGLLSLGQEFIDTHAKMNLK